MKMKVFAVLLMILVILGGCGKGESISEEDLEKYSELAKSPIEYAVDGDYEIFKDICDDIMKSAIDEKAFEQLTEILNQKGKISEFLKSDGFYSENQQTKEYNITIILKVKHEKGNYTYTVSFNENGELTGFFVK